MTSHRALNASKITSTPHRELSHAKNGSTHGALSTPDTRGASRASVVGGQPELDGGGRSTTLGAFREYDPHSYSALSRIKNDSSRILPER